MRPTWSARMSDGTIRTLAKQKHVEDVTVTTGFEGSTGSVGWSVETVDHDGLEVRVVLSDADGAQVATG
ncbi:MAG TPA: hypothetical protein VLA55_11120, partial [Ornithinibacter sp.]|nr:hypothetical protein [Ornithinibacter sp.]